MSRNIYRGDIYWISLGEYNYSGSHVQRGVRPCVVVSNDVANRHSPVVTICPLSTKMDCLPMHPTIQIDFLYKPSRTQQVLCEQMLTIDKDSLRGYFGCVGTDQMREVDKALMIQLGLNTPCKNIQAELLVNRGQEVNA